MIREPIVQGSFYPDKSAELARIIDNYLGSPNNQGTTSASDTFTISGGAITITKLEDGGYYIICNYLIDYSIVRFVLGG